ncbi:MAG: HEAT repeat domain-containing protein [Gammaproteobacteria bacterium]|nr:HEAT repeat domain-containing protein [Gammaproteobacteria bacterium]MDH3431505.1 HEAT repeat domain-containing protein [Gammaproteobacteria bacterium]MDH3433397.1 HEAT repeat domain-containing protein [Gammaproteobacteria bacterium]
MEWLFRYDFDTLTTIALWSIAAVLATTVILFVYTVGLRVATISSNQQRRSFLARWRDVFATSMLDREFAAQQTLPRVRRADRIDLLEEWNRARSMVYGSAVDNLIDLATRSGIPDLARRLFRSRRMRSRILAVQTVGHLRLPEFRAELGELVNDENTALSITAAAALVDIDADSGIALVVPMINRRRDWPKTRVSILLRQAGSERISEPMYRAIRSEGDSGKTYLLQFARLMEAEILDALVGDLLRESRDPGVLNAALKLVSGFAGVPRIAALTQNDAWFVRMQAAKVLGRVGQEEHLSLLEALLDDPEWWVRYRAAQAITTLPFLGPNQLRRIRLRQSDPFAGDILQQAFAEVGLA